MRAWLALRGEGAMDREHPQVEFDPGAGGATAGSAPPERLRHADRIAVIGKAGGAFARGLAGPIAAIAERAGRIAGGGLPPAELAPEARRIAELGDGIVADLRRLVDFVRGPAPGRGPVEAGAVVDEVLALLAPLAAERGVAMRRTGEPGPLRPRLDTTGLRQLVAALVHNGIQAMPGGGELTVELRVEAPTGAEAALLLRVRDRGEGVAAPAAERIFEPFYTTRDPGRAAGLGLAAARDIVLAAAGRIELEPVAAPGSCLLVRLPLEAAP
ncbi:MAG: hypothetical protein HY907_10710 [Deltaproteobacteria bacterium]|nr:hypothetical protein [Deltaproteobacteria bacterium]